MKGYVYLLKCSDGSFYTGSTKYLNERVDQHISGQGANYTKKYKPCKLIYFEEFARIDQAFYREKQIQKWSRKKKLALVEGNQELVKELSKKVF